MEPPSTPWRRPQPPAAACRSGAPHGVAKAQHGLDMPLRIGEGSVSGVPSREGLGTPGWGKLGDVVERLLRLEHNRQMYLGVEEALSLPHRARLIVGVIANAGDPAQPIRRVQASVHYLVGDLQRVHLRYVQAPDTGVSAVQFVGGTARRRRNFENPTASHSSTRSCKAVWLCGMRSVGLGSGRRQRNCSTAASGKGPRL